MQDSRSLVSLMGTPGDTDTEMKWEAWNQATDNPSVDGSKVGAGQ